MTKIASPLRLLEFSPVSILTRTAAARRLAPPSSLCQATHLLEGVSAVGFWVYLELSVEGPGLLQGHPKTAKCLALASLTAKL
jgi:hypothetical protein